ncbi:MAG: hypothetical protein CMF45_00445 [Legionellales bacterium]|nr:hypothetical protein [Legionellales bacterium]
MINTKKEIFIATNVEDITTAVKASDQSLGSASIAFTKLNKYTLSVKLFEYSETTGEFTPVKLDATESLVAAMRNSEDDSEVGEIGAFSEVDSSTAAVAETFVIQCATAGADADVYITLELPDGTKKVIWFDVAQADGTDMLSPATGSSSSPFDTHEAVEVEATLTGEIVTNLASALSGIDGITATADTAEDRVTVSFDTAGKVSSRPRVAGTDSANFNIHTTQFGKDAVNDAVYEATLEAYGTGWDELGEKDSFTAYLSFVIDGDGVNRTIARKLITCERNFIS